MTTTNRTPKQQEYRDNLAHTIKNLRKYHKGRELSQALLDDEMMTYDYVESLGNGKKLNKEKSLKWRKKEPFFVLRNLENFDLDNNKLAKKLLRTNHGAGVLTFLRHFKGLDKEVANMLINEGCIEEVLENMDSFNEPAKEYIRSLDEKNVDSKGNDEIENSEIESNEVENNYIEEVKVKENINVDYENWDMSQEVKDYFSKSKFEKPFFDIEFDGKKMYLTKLQPVLCYDYGFVGFIEVNGKYEIRYFIKSGSEQLWRCCPGYRNGRAISKLDEFNNGGLKPEIKQQYEKAGFNFTGNFSYERSTMVDFRLGEYLERIYMNSLNENGRYYHEHFDPRTNERIYQGRADSSGESTNFDKGIAERCIKMSREINIIDDFSSKFGRSIQGYTIEKVKNIYRKETIGIDAKSLILEKGKKYVYYHTEFNSFVDVEVCKAKMLGKEVEIFFSHTRNEPNLVWIDNIQYKNQPMNSYGIPAKQINAGWLTKKPVDYATQCPEFDKLSRVGQYKDYKDIRFLYQENPLIRRYKELSGIK